MTLKSAIFILLPCYLCCFHLEIVGSAKILAIYPNPCYSHFKTFQPLLEELIIRGHNLTLLSNITLNDEFLKNYTQLNIESNFVTRENKLVKMNPLEEIVFVTKFNIGLFERIIQSPEVQELIHSKNHYDLIIGELFFSTDIFFVLGKKFNAPVISTTSQCMISHHTWILGNPDPFHFPNSFLKVTEKMSFVSRTVNAGFHLISILFYEFYSLPQYQILIEKYFGFEKENLPSIKDVMKNISVSLVNSHHSLAYIKPDLPNIINVGGIHLKSPNPLPQRFMDEAEHGVIYVSFGSLLKTGPLYQLGVTLIGILKTLPQRIIIKWDQQLMPTSKNILIGEWFPQSDILNHPNCRLFITHGGYLSLLESLNASVPVIGIPFFGDQHYNMGMVEYFELGMKTELDNVPLELPGNINEVLKNPKYKNNMRKRSLLFRDRLTSPLDTALYWIDHVLKHRDTTHLKSASVRLTWYEFYSLDVLGVLFVIAGAILFTLKLILTTFMSLVLVLNRKTRLLSEIKSRQEGMKINSKID